VTGAILSGPIRCGIALSLFAIGWTMASKYAIFNGHTSAAYQMLYHFDKSKTHICYISLSKGAVYSLFLTRCPPIGFTSIKHKGHMPYCLVYQMVWAPI